VKTARYVLRSPSGAVMGLLVLAALAAPMVWPDPRAVGADRLMGPSWGHPLGTTLLGQDVLAQVAHALRVDLLLGVLAVLVSAFVGVSLGGVAGYLGGLADRLVGAVADLTQALPVALILIALAFALGPGASTILVAFALLGWLPYARLARTEVARVRNLEYVHAAELIGLPRRTVVRRHVALNSFDQVLVYAAADIGVAVQTVATLAFLGVALPDGTLEIGRMIATGAPRLRTAWWLTVFPGLALVVLGVTSGRLARRLGAPLKEYG
jgi:peptide/nickel transport system permease protein